MFDNEMHLSFSSLSQNEAFARAVVGAFASQLNPTLEELSDIRTAISEAVTNAVIHGYGGGPGLVYLDCGVKGNTLTITVRDEGVGIEDVDLARQPFYTSHPELERSGMGFAVMEAFMQELTVSSQVGSGTSITMIKRIKRTDGQ